MNTGTDIEVRAVKKRDKNLPILEFMFKWFRKKRKIAPSHVRLLKSHVLLPAQPPLSMGFSMQEYWSGLPFPFPGENSQPRN